VSLETAIENLTAAILAQTEASKHNFDMLKNNVTLVTADISQPATEEITTDRSEMKKAAAARKVAKPVVEPDPEPEAVEEVYELVEEEIEPEPEPELEETPKTTEPVFPEDIASWPEHKRNAYYQQFIYPFTAKLQTLDKDALIKMVREEFKSPRGGREIPAEKWEALLARTKEIIDEIETINALAG